MKTDEAIFILGQEVKGQLYDRHPYLDEAIEHAIDCMKRSPWQPIESAPISNGSKTFLVNIKGHGQVVAFRFENGQFWNASKQWGGGQEYLKPTHWMPLPDAPKEGE